MDVARLTLLLEIIKALLVVFKLSDAGAFCFVLLWD